MSLLCELLAIVVKFMLRSPILLSESTSENLTGAQRDDAKSGLFYEGLASIVHCPLPKVKLFGRVNLA